MLHVDAIRRPSVGDPEGGALPDPTTRLLDEERRGALHRRGYPLRECLLPRVPDGVGARGPWPPESPAGGVSLVDAVHLPGSCQRRTSAAVYRRNWFQKRHGLLG